MIICKSCKNIIANKYYKCLWIGDHKSKLVICQECWIMFYIHKPDQFKKDHPEEYEKEYKYIYTNKCQKQILKIF